MTAAMIETGANSRANLPHARWRKSSYSNSQGTCVEIACQANGEIWVRDSKAHRGPVVVLTSAAAQVFLQTLI